MPDSRAPPFRLAAARVRQVRGGAGHLGEHGVGKIVHNLMDHQILEGTNEIMLLMVARGLIEAVR